MAPTIFKNCCRLPYFNRKETITVFSTFLGGALGGLLAFVLLELLEACRR